MKQNYKKTINIDYYFSLPSRFTTTTGGYFAIQISSQTTKKEVSESPCCKP
jgi:hypothetical protein